MLDTSTHTVNVLFEQLGLPSSDAAIADFVASHRPLADDILLEDAAFWDENQASFLREAIAEDADWAEAVDHLDALLRHEGGNR